jgi:acetyltransferase
MDGSLSKAFEALFFPVSLAVIGSVREGKIANQILTQLHRGGFEGSLWAVNPKGEVPKGLDEVRAVSSISEIPGSVDLALVCAPAAAAAEVLEEAGEKGIPVSVIISSGFGEIGHHREEQELREIARRYGMRLIGPNCAGIMNPHHRLFASIEVRAFPGSIAFVTQSGAVGGAVLAMAEERGIGFSRFLSYGNRVDLGEEEILAYLESDPTTKVIALYVESLQDGRSFMEAALRLSRKKPLVLIKAGRSEAGNRAASSHTGSFTGSDEVFQAMVCQTNTIRVAGIEEMLDLCQGFALLPEVKRKRIAVVTNSGGPGILTTDRAELLGLDIPRPSEEIRQKLYEFLPGHSSVSNPIDLTVEGTEEGYRRSLETLLGSDEYDAAVTINVATPFLDSTGLARGIADAAAATGKAVTAAFMAGRIVETGEAELKRRGIPIFPTGERAAAVLAAMAEYYRRRDLPDTSFESPGRQGQAPLSSAGMETLKSPILMHEAFELLGRQGFSLPRYRFVPAGTPPSIHLDDLTFPLAMKVVSPLIAHKSDVGGVALNIKSIEELDRAFTDMEDRLMDRAFRGVIIHEMIPQGAEIILGIKRDPTFGPVVVVGAGGIYTELLRDVSLRIAPVDAAEAEKQLRELKTFKLLDGFRGAPKLAVTALARQVELLSLLALGHPEIVEMDLNPLFVLENDAVVGDVHIVIDESRDEGEAPNAAAQKGGSEKDEIDGNQG